MSLERIDNLSSNYGRFKSEKFLPIGEARKGEGGIRTKGYYKKSCRDNPLISIITVVFNGVLFLEETILSVINQTYDNLEYIIIDGGSTDGSLDIIKKYDHKIDYWVSEHDKGISDAFNKGVKVANGKYINFQGDGDGFYSQDALEKVFRDVNYEEDIFVSAKVERVDINGRRIYVSKHIDKFDKKLLLFRMALPHQGLFTHIDYFRKYGLFDIDNQFCMDYEHLLRSYKKFPKVVNKNIIVAKWRADGLGTGRTLDILEEYNKIKRDNKVINFVVLDLIKSWNLIKYYLNLVLGRV